MPTRLSGCSLEATDVTGLVGLVEQVNGHLKSKLDPIGLDARPVPIELDPALYGFTEADLDRE